MLKLLTIALIYLFIIYDIFPQTKPNPKQDYSKVLPGKIILEYVDEFMAQFSYELKSPTITLFISEISKPERQVILSDKNILGDDTIVFPGLKKIEKVGRFISSSFAKKTGKFVIDGLVSQQDYYLHLYTPKSKDSDTLIYLNSIAFNTLAPKPKNNAYQIAFEDITDTSFAVTWVNGDGDGRIVIVAKSEQLPLPENGKTYRTSITYGKDFSRVGEGYVVYDGNDARPRIVVTNLEPATKYIVGVIEYNGEGKYRNYSTNFSMTNPRNRTTMLSTPKIKTIDNFPEGRYIIRWNKVKGASTYILDLAKDKGFNEKVEPYVDLDIGDLGEYELSDLEPKTKYYIRLKAKGAAGESLYSPPFDFKTK